MEKKLRVKQSTFQTTLSFNEWVEKYGVGSGYIEPTRYYQGNAGSPRITMDTRLEMQPQRKSSGENKPNLLGRLLSFISF